MAIIDRRNAAVAAAIDEIRDIAAREGASRAALDHIEPVLVALATQSTLFPPGDFPVPEGRPGRIYHLSEDRDGRFALYASAGAAGKFQPPHNHTTWAVIAGVHGEEHNTCYRRTDDGSREGHGTLERTGERTVRHGNSIAFLPDDFHTIEVIGGKPALHLHLYGKTLEDLPGRIGFEDAEGGPWRRFMSRPEIFAPLIAPAELAELLRDGAELALVDLRGAADFAAGHIAGARATAADRIADAADDFRGITVLCAADEAAAQEAAVRLRAAGARGMAVLAGGIPGWRRAGFDLAG